MFNMEKSSKNSNIRESIKKIAVIGAGFTGKQIAARCALYDYNVFLYDVSSDALKEATKFLSKVFRPKDKREKYDNLKIVQDFSKALNNVDLVIEAVPENLELKKNVFKQIDQLSPLSTIISTNSSSFPVSKLEDAVNRKDKVLNLHFYPPIPQRPMVDIMRGSQTSEDTIQKGVEWIKSIGCEPLKVNKEIMGFAFNRIWRAVKREALHMWAGDYVDFNTIDKAWKIFTGMNLGPFETMDAIGLDIVYNVEMSYYKESGDPRDKPPEKFKKKVENGELGLKTKKGFYKW